MRERSLIKESDSAESKPEGSKDVNENSIDKHHSSIQSKKSIASKIIMKKFEYNT